ncbi:adenylyl-sulfate reductase subunit alpha [Calderihabitans maritimus]|uniref:Adenylylsulfate reductase subunit alpha n=1 Tax=Calderihabitans maritimus TaxID=1246530 RepID=A0A1Z5HW27_9FIRM|nr:adenylyl-sulfate reductase subunit alpha [Calderihabitans maritimus]GAW93557.1 adenylylsulfate reductase subunit alpha [Calderihabitans maritimus]
MKRGQVKVERITADILIIGGGTAGCMAAVAAWETNPDCRVVVMEKAHIERSGCLAAGINALNAYLNPGETPESFLEYVRRESYGVVRDDLVLSMAVRLKDIVKKLEKWGLPIPRDEHGNYLARGRRSIHVYGERIKPLLARAVARSGALVLNRTVATDYIVMDGRVMGAFGFNVRTGDFYVVAAQKVICTTGGAAGIYLPCHPLSAPHRTWYSPFNTGTGYAMGIRAGAEMTSLEARFIALRVKDTLAPTGTVAQGLPIPQVNSRGEKYLEPLKGCTTAMRLWATMEEIQGGRGPCFLDTRVLSPGQSRKLKEAYLNMTPAMVLYWANRGTEPQEAPLEVSGTEPYIVGGHGLAGYWVDERRRTTLPGLYAAGDAAGGAPKKYASGSMVEGHIAGSDAAHSLNRGGPPDIPEELVRSKLEEIYAPFKKNQGVSAVELETALQEVMDYYAGGIGRGYGTSEKLLATAREKVAELKKQVTEMSAEDSHDLMRVWEVRDKLDLAAAVIEHLLYRRETRWPCYQVRWDYPFRDDRRWLVFVNSIYDAEEERFNMLERPVGGKAYAGGRKLGFM